MRISSNNLIPPEFFGGILFIFTPSLTKKMGHFNFHYTQKNLRDDDYYQLSKRKNKNSFFGKY